MGTRFSAPVQTGPGAHPASCTMGTGSFPWVKRPERDADHPPSSKRRGHEMVQLYLYSPSEPQWVEYRENFTFTFIFDVLPFYKQGSITGRKFVFFRYVTSCSFVDMHRFTDIYDVRTHTAAIFTVRAATISSLSLSLSLSHMHARTQAQCLLRKLQSVT